MEILNIYLEDSESSVKVLCDKAFNVAKNPKYDGYQRGLASMVYKFFEKKFAVVNTLGGAIKLEIMPNQQLAEELNKPTIKIYKN